MSYFKELPTKMIMAFKRFPLTLIWVTIGSFFVISLINNRINIFSIHYKEVITLILGVSWLIGAQFITESHRSKLVGWAVKTAIVLLLILYYFNLPENHDAAQTHTFLRWFILLLAGHIFIFFAPFIFYWNTVDYWNYLRRIIVAISRSILFSGIIYLGLSLALLAIENLFTFNIPVEIYFELFIFCLGIINTFIYLSDFPKEIYNTQKLHYSTALDVLIKYILVPILILYLLIVYAYSFTILLTWQLPEGWVSYLISILAITGFIIYIIIDPIREKHQNLIIRKFHPILQFSLLPLFILLFVAIYARINAYNFTENRYLLLILAFWLLGITLFTLISKKRKLALLPISLFILCLLSIYGPWNVFRVSTQAQSNELSELIIKTNNGEQALTGDEVERFKNITRYLKEREKLNLIDDEIGFETYYLKHSYSAGKYMLDSIYGKNNYTENKPSNFDDKSFYYNNYNFHDEINIKGYEKFINVSASTFLHQKNRSPYNLEIDQSEIILRNSFNELFRIDMENDIIEKLQKYQSLTNIPEGSFVYELNKKAKFKVVIISLNGTNQNNKIKIKSITAYIFIG